MVTRPFRGTGQTFREQRERHAQWVGFSGRSRGVISTCQSGFGEGDLGSGKALDHAHGSVAVRTWPGSKLAGQRCSVSVCSSPLDLLLAAGDHAAWNLGKL
jgi:hypothetical protein